MELTEKLDGLFDISVPGVEDRLEMDWLREKEAREEDLMFLADQRDHELRKMNIEKERDVEYNKAVKDKTMRGSRDATMKSKIATNNNKNTEVEDKEDEISDENESEDYEPPKRREY